MADDDGDDGGPVKPKAKRVKKEVKIEDDNGDSGMTDQDMAAISDKGLISKQSVGVLKEFLKARGKSTTGKKIELVERIQGYLEGKGF